METAIHEKTYQFEQALARTVKARRRVLGLSNGQFAAKLGVSQSHASDLQNGQRAFTVARIIAVAEVLGTSVHQLIKEADEKINR
jgi:transcriptional regulator with XRE-family HTH domain